MKNFFLIAICAALVALTGCDADPSVSQQSSNDAASQRTNVTPPPAMPAATGLPIGSEAPEIVGKDLDGVEFKLSDYRGQVVMLDFYGDW